MSWARIACKNRVIKRLYKQIFRQLNENGLDLLKILWRRSCEESIVLHKKTRRNSSVLKEKHLKEMKNRSVFYDEKQTRAGARSERTNSHWTLKLFGTLLCLRLYNSVETEKKTLCGPGGNNHVTLAKRDLIHRHLLPHNAIRLLGFFSLGAFYNVILVFIFPFWCMGDRVQWIPTHSQY